MTPEILYKSKNAVVIYKPPTMPSQADVSGGDDALTLTANILRESGEREELYLINRLDRVVGGLMILARNKDAARKLTDILSKDSFSKEYFAVADGVVESGEMVDWLIKDSASGKGLVSDASNPKAKKAMLNLQLLDTVTHKGKPKSLVRIKLKTGRFHQIRVQLSSRGASLVGDKKYGNKDFNARNAALFAYRLSATIDSETIEVKKFPDVDKYPWNLFSAEKYYD